ncbi:hypothetical protein PNOK_0528600 [Pyrrhoderma noxium]|uniref:Uncharacterized protein n=1 Tax=Pyrrhoderma noxium TaxID=2282107 RepID=A0A286UG31_9AGAM|nr:hypothetical protein PNOK_0528600 [Pyrrhoderma noxium]
MQQPTCTNIRIRSTRDAHIIFHAVSIGLLPMISRRLDNDERAALRSGNVYAWEERGSHTEVTGLGIERFTEGRRWGPSRVRDEFLFYYEKSPPGHLRDKENPLIEERVRKQWDPLVKQTYSVFVNAPSGRRKWHLTAYFTQATVDRLQTVDDIPHLAGLEVPPSKYISTRLGKPRRNEDTSNNTSIHPSQHDVFRPNNLSAARTYAPFPLPYQVTSPTHHQTVNHPYVTDTNRQYPGHLHLDYPQQPHGRPNAQRDYYGPASAHGSHYLDNSLTLPPIGTVSNSGANPALRHTTEYTSPQQGYYQQQRQFIEGHPSHQQSYAPYSPPSDHQRGTLQLPTPVSSSSHSPLYSPHEYPESSSVYSGPASGLPFHPTSSASTNYPQNYCPTPDERGRLPPPITIPTRHSQLPSPLSRSPGEHSYSYSPRRTSHPPPISDARDDHSATFDSASPPQSPVSAVSSVSTPGGKQLNLAPLRTLVRAHPYKRDKFDDRALMAFSGRKVSE